MGRNRKIRETLCAAPPDSFSPCFQTGATARLSPDRYTPPGAEQAPRSGAEADSAGKFPPPPHRRRGGTRCTGNAPAGVPSVVVPVPGVASVRTVRRELSSIGRAVVRLHSTAAGRAFGCSAERSRSSSPVPVRHSAPANTSSPVEYVPIHPENLASSQPPASWKPC